MTRRAFIIVFMILASCMFAQSKINIFLFPGQGSDYRIFDSLDFDLNKYNIVHIAYPVPKKSMSLKEYSLSLAHKIDTLKPFILIGVSLGGMICCELSEVLRPEKVIIISSAKKRSELPLRYRFQKAIPLYKLVPASLIKTGAKMLQPLVERDRRKNKSTFKKMLNAKDSKFMKRTVEMIIKWDRKTNSKKIFHIHGTKDHTLPYRYVKPDYTVEKGSHMMTLTDFKRVQEYIDLILRPQRP